MKSKAEQAFDDTLKTKPKRAYIVVSDLCGSTERLANDFHVGVALQHAHETLCLDVSKRLGGHQTYKAMGDGVWMEFDDPVRSCRIALALIAEAKQLRDSSSKIGTFCDFHLKVVVVAGDFIRASGTQIWLGVLPTRAARISAFARPDEVWIDGIVKEAIGAHKIELAAEYDEHPGNGAAFRVFLKGFKETAFAIHQLRPAATRSSLTDSDKLKVWFLTWIDVMALVEKILGQIRDSKFQPSRVVGIGRSGAILGGIIAGNLKDHTEHGHLPVDVIERSHVKRTGPLRKLSTLTEKEELYRGDKMESDPNQQISPAWQQEPILLVIGEAKTDASFQSAETWLRRRGINTIKRVALLTGSQASADYYGLSKIAENAWLPWQMAGYDDKWPTYQRT